jgi:hypothetical protein
MKYHIIIKSATKGTQTDHWENGSNPDSYKQHDISPPHQPPESITDAFRQLVGDSTITAQEIRTIDPNTYCDLKTGGVRTVEDNQAAGVYRCTYNRNENSHGRKPSAKEQADFEAGRISLKLADYDIYFTIQLVGMDETELATYLGCGGI